MGIGYDRYNALSSAQKWDAKYTTVQVRQHSDTLHPPTKLLYEKIMNREFKYETNKCHLSIATGNILGKWKLFCSGWITFTFFTLY